MRVMFPGRAVVPKLLGFRGIIGKRHNDRVSVFLFLLLKASL